jgi:glycosyltransferase involved in cell wall biosynthesis
LILVGDGPMCQKLKEDLPDAVLTGALPPEDVAVAMASADLFMFPSDTDSAGNVVLEAQASGLPVVVSSEGGPKEYIRPGESGIVCRPGDPESFAREAAHLIRNTRPRAEMSRAARAHGLTLRWEAALEPLYRAYKEVAACGSHTAHAGTASAAAPDGAAA